jgi:hypothetical protein
MSKNDFLTKQNVSLLWEVIMDNDIMKNKPQIEISQIIDIFNVNLKKFHDSTNNNNLTELNKNYITVIMNFINKNFNKPAQPPPVEKKLVTYEELQNDRLSKFEKDFNSRQQEFTSAMALPIPPTPDFSDKKDEPLSEIEVEVKRYMAQRNYDVEQLNKTIANNNDNQASSWLKPQETSLKSEKLTLPLPLNKNPIPQNPIPQNPIPQNPIKYIKIDNETNVSKNIIQKDVIDLNNSNNKKKVISWADERTDERNNESNYEFRTDESIRNEIIDQQIETNIFSKLKTIPSKKDDLGDLKEEMKVLHQKLDLILSFMNKN